MLGKTLFFAPSCVKKTDHLYKVLCGYAIQRKTINIVYCKFSCDKNSLSQKIMESFQSFKKTRSVFKSNELYGEGNHSEENCTPTKQFNGVYGFPNPHLDSRGITVFSSCWPFSAFDSLFIPMIIQTPLNAFVFQ